MHNNVLPFLSYNKCGTVCVLTATYCTALVLLTDINPRYSIIYSSRIFFKTESMSQAFSGSSYVSPKVSADTFFITCGSIGLSPQLVGVSAILFTTSIPSVIFPNAA